MESYNYVQTNLYYLIGMVIWDDVILHKILVLDRNDWFSILHSIYQCANKRSLLSKKMLF